MVAPLSGQGERAAIEEPASVPTNGSGYSDVWNLAKGFYYVQAAMTSPLYGMSPSVDTTNPSAIVAVGPGDREADFSFQ
jgi:hypothetical protein